ncbi:MAG: ABC transporter ATP-binding protein [Anaerolineaceae bacterium]|nr:ABC transporter ATP-binding protein [Anaerolineaceae bacterium]
MMNDSLLEIRDLHLEFHTFEGVAKVLAGVNLQLRRGEFLGLVGETGCGKSMTALAIPRLIPIPPGRITRGEVIFEGKDLLQLNDKGIESFRARELGYVFQDPVTNLNPMFSIREQLIDAVVYQSETNGRKPAGRRRRPASSRQKRRDAFQRSIELLHMVGIPDADRRIHDYPHQFSGGMRQRVLIAMALAGEPKLLIADEPTTALDVTIQAQILRLIQELGRKMGLSVLLITHNLGVVAKICDRVAVMYSGRVIETAPVRDLFNQPLHPYTQGLLKALPHAQSERGGLEGIPGHIPDLISPPAGCRFHPRCAHAMDHCREVVPPVSRKTAEHHVFCHLFDETEEYGHAR